jgi:hypothetical protein
MKRSLKKLLLKNRNIFSGAIAAFVIAIALALFSSYNMISYVTEMHEELQSMFERDVTGQNNIQSARIYLLYIDSECKSMLLTDNDTEREISVKKMEKLKISLSDRLKRAYPLYSAWEVADRIKRTRQAQADYMKSLDSLMAAAAGEKGSALEMFNRDTRSGFETLDSLLSELNAIKQRKDDQTYRRMILKYKSTFYVTIALLLGTIVIRIIMALLAHKKSRKGRAAS